MIDARFGVAIAAIDAANADDPVRVIVDGVDRPKEVAHAERMTGWVERLDPEATEAQLLAARAHHLRRWSIPRASFPEGRAGYLRWRATLNRQHADEVAEILVDAGYDAATVERVQAIVLKKGRESDAGVQTHEDALCLTFLELQSAEVTAQLGADKMTDVVTKTLAKMSDRAIGVAAELDLDDRVAAVLSAAIAASE